MVLIQSPLKRNYMKELLDGKTIEDITFTFVREEKITLYFETTGDAAAAAAIAKKTIKNSALGSALFFSVNYE